MNEEMAAYLRQILRDLDAIEADVARRVAKVRTSIRRQLGDARPAKRIKTVVSPVSGKQIDLEAKRRAFRKLGKP